MNFYDYLKLAARNTYLIIIVTLISAGGGYIFSQSLNANPYGATLFVTFGIEDKTTKTTSSYENLQAADQMTDSIQGWFKDPSFTNEINRNSKLDTNIQAKKQEKDNLLINFSSSDQESALLITNQILKSLNSRITQYNSQSDLKVTIATYNLDISLQTTKNNILILVGGIIGFLVGFFGSLLWENIIQVIKSNRQFEALSGKKILTSYNNDKEFKKNYFFLSKYLNEKYGQQPLQIIDLTHKNKFGLETISKHTELGEIKTLKLPADFSKISLYVPTLLILEIGYSKIKLINELDNFKFSHLEVISLQKISR